MFIVFPEYQHDIMRTATRSIAVLMLIGMIIQINCVFVCYSLFFLNQKSIAETVCEKKTKDCCGHFFLHKKIAATTDTQSAPTEKQMPTKTQEELLSVMRQIYYPPNA